MSYKQQWYLLQKTYVVKSKHVFNYIKLQLVFFLLFLLLLCAHIHLFAPACSQSTFPVKGGTNPLSSCKKCTWGMHGKPGSVWIETFSTHDSGFAQLQLSDISS